MTRPPPGQRSSPRESPRATTRPPKPSPSVAVPADVLQSAAQLVIDAGEHLGRAEGLAYWTGWHAGRLAGREEGWAAGHAAGMDAGGAAVLLALRAGWPDLRPARRLVSRRYVDLLDGPGVAAPCTCSCCRRDGRAS